MAKGLLILTPSLSDFSFAICSFLHSITTHQWTYIWYRFSSFHHQQLVLCFNRLVFCGFRKWFNRIYQFVVYYYSIYCWRNVNEAKVGHLVWTIKPVVSIRSRSTVQYNRIKHVFIRFAFVSLGFLLSAFCMQVHIQVNREKCSWVSWVHWKKKKSTLFFFSYSRAYIIYERLLKMSWQLSKKYRTIGKWKKFKPNKRKKLDDKKKEAKCYKNMRSSGSFLYLVTF